MAEENLKLEDLLGKNNFSDEAINSVAIIGAGVMGQGIAQTISASGIEVTIIERNEDNLKKAKESLGDSIDNEIKRWAL
ncbi:MAG: 3-hydroxyacyl-CoA dehydrogenase NAD-binding domain-containing protein, partial [Ignavibacteriaceae bacterium]